MKKFSKSLVEHSPHLIVEWHPTKNGNLLPSEKSFGWFTLIIEFLIIFKEVNYEIRLT